MKDVRPWSIINHDAMPGQALGKHCTFSILNSFDFGIWITSEGPPPPFIFLPKSSTYSVYVSTKPTCFNLASWQILHPSVISFQSIGSLYRRSFNWRTKAFNRFQNRAQWYWIQSDGKCCLWNLRCGNVHSKCVNLSVPQQLSSSALNTVVYWSIIHYSWISLCE